MAYKHNLPLQCCCCCCSINKHYPVDGIRVFVLSFNDDIWQAINKQHPHRSYAMLALRTSNKICKHYSRKVDNTSSSSKLKCFKIHLYSSLNFHCQIVKLAASQSHHDEYSYFFAWHPFEMCWQSSLLCPTLDDTDGSKVLAQLFGSTPSCPVKWLNKKWRNCLELNLTHLSFDPLPGPFSKRV